MTAATGCPFWSQTAPARPTDPRIFRDLGTGPVYGEFAIARDQAHQELELKLNQAAIRDINRTRGDFFSVGGRLTSVSGGAGAEFKEEYIFGNSGESSDDTVQLVTRT